MLDPKQAKLIYKDLEIIEVRLVKLRKLLETVQILNGADKKKKEDFYESLKE